MHEITNHKQRGFKLVIITDSITGESSKTCCSGEFKTCWVKPRYINGVPCLTDPGKIYTYNEGEKPDQKEGWAYALGGF